MCLRELKLEHDVVSFAFIAVERVRVFMSTDITTHNKHRFI